MRRLLIPCALVLALAALGRADDAADAKAVVEKAIQARGGADNLAKYKADVLKVKGAVHVSGLDIDFTGEISFQQPDKSRTVIEGTVMGTNFKSTRVVNGDKGWIDDLLGATQSKRDMSKEELAEERESQNANSIIRLAVLTDKAYTLSTVGESKVGDKEAVGILVKRKGYRDVSLFFDKKTHLLLKSETRVKDPQGGGDTEFTQEAFYDDYKKVGDLQVAHKLTIKRDGKAFLESEATEFKPEEKLDDGLFAKP